jgi:hypothetical protein
MIKISLDRALAQRNDPENDVSLDDPFEEREALRRVATPIEVKGAASRLASVGLMKAKASVVRALQEAAQRRQRERLGAQGLQDP